MKRLDWTGLRNTSSSSACSLCGLKFLHLAQFWMAFITDKSSLGEWYQSVRAIFSALRPQCPPVLCRCSAFCSASDLGIHSTRLHGWMLVPPCMCHSLPSSIRYCDVWCHALFLSRIGAMVSMLSMASMTSRYSGLSAKQVCRC